jgi:HK97 family phage portal protein
VRAPLPTPPLLQRPAAGTMLPGWTYAVMVSLLLRGNTYGIITARSGASMLPAQVELVHPDRMQVRLSGEGLVEYRLGGTVYDPADVWHVKAYEMPGSMVGLSPVSYAKQAIGLGLAAERFGGQLFGSGAVPAAILRNTQKTVRGDQAEEVKARFKEAVAGRDVFVTGADWSYAAVAISPEEAQFIEARKFQVAEIARVFGVPAELIGGDPTGSHTYTSVEQRGAEYLTFSLRPWLVRLETAIGALLPPGQYVRFNSGGLLKPTLRDRYEAHKLAIEAGFLTVNEVRQLEDRPPLEQAA